MNSENLTISKLAASAGVHIETVRYYQRRGLLSEPQRPLGGIRRYGASELARLKFIRRAQLMGFSLVEISGLLEMKGLHACELTKQLTEIKLADVRRRLSELNKLEIDLVELIAECSQVRLGECCPTLDILEHAEMRTATTVVGKRLKYAV